MVIVGSGKAAARAVVGFREHGWKGSITLIGEEKHLPYDLPPLSKAAITAEEEPQPVLLLDESMLGSLGVTRISGVAVAAIDRAAKSVTLADGRRIRYARLLIATGARARKLNIPGGEHARTLRSFEDSVWLRAAFTPGRSIAIIGGGFIGLELAASASKRGCTVTVIEALPRILMRGVPQAIADVVAARHKAAGVTILTGVIIDRIEKDGVVFSGGRKIAADVIVAGIGAAPEVSLAQAAGLAIDNGIVCNAQLQTSDPHIFAAGDCCSFPHGVFGNRRLRLEAWRSAQDQGAVAAENMLGGGKAYRRGAMVLVGSVRTLVADRRAAQRRHIERQAAGERRCLHPVRSGCGRRAGRRQRHRAGQFHRPRHPPCRNADRQTRGTRPSTTGRSCRPTQIIAQGLKTRS